MDHVTRTQRSYDLVAQQYLARNHDRSVLTPWFERFRALLAADAVVLDLGAGPCSDAAELSARGLRVAALDRSAPMLQLGREHFAGPRVRGDLRRLPLASGRFAGVWANASLLHLQRSELPVALAETRRVLAPAGVLYVSLKRGEGERWDQASYGPDRDRWFSYYREEELDAALSAAGFELLEASTKEASNHETWLARVARAR